MKFGETFMEYLHGEQEWFLDKCRHVEYKKLKKVLKRCKTCNSTRSELPEDEEQISTLSESCQYCQSCPLCDQMFFSELKKEASDIAGCFRSRVRHLLHLHVANGMQRCVLRLRRCFMNDKQALVHEGQILIRYITMNAIAIRKILKKYDKVHSSENGKNFKLKMRAEHIELLHSPWLIELGAFYLNYGLEKGENFNESCGHVSCDLNTDQPMMKLMLLNSIMLEFDLTCAICLETMFNPYALRCGHVFCKACACSAASVMIFQGVKAASPRSKCAVCREAGVYADAVHMLELDLLLKRRRKEYWKERMMAERSETVKQSKAFWNEQAKYMIGY